MPSRVAKIAPPTDFPEFAVKRERISSFFDPPLARSTFHDLVNQGKIIPLKGVRGLYLLNDSLRRLGLREVPCLPKDPAQRSMEDILRLGFTMIDELLFPLPSWVMMGEDLDSKEVDHARRVAIEHQESIASLDSIEEKLAYFAGVLDSQVEMEES